MTPIQLDIEIAKLCTRAYDESTYNINGSQVLIEESRNYLFICFRGTDDISDMLRNILAAPWRPCALGHWTRLGFWNYVKPLIDPVLSHVMRSNKRLVLGGHSLGGTAAVHFGAVCKNLGVNVNRMTTFGCPKTGWEGLANHTADIQGGRYVRDGDSVASIPWTGTHDRMPRMLLGNSAILGDHNMAEYLEELLKETPA